MEMNVIRSNPVALGRNPPDSMIVQPDEERSRGEPQDIGDQLFSGVDGSSSDEGDLAGKKDDDVAADLIKIGEKGFNNRILICDDNRDIHADFLKILNSGAKSSADLVLEDFEEALFDGDPEFSSSKKIPAIEYQVDSAYQGKQALQMVDQADSDGNPYAVVFMDVRMPPGWDGIRTVDQIWRKHPFTEVVIVTAYSDYTWDEMVEALGVNDKLLFIKKPFDSVGVKQLALNLTTKWNLAHRARQHVVRLEKEVRRRVEAIGKTLRGM